MKNRILGIHHITAIAGNAKRNHDFYTKVLGLRLVKKTVNFDDPGTYHFYFGDETGTPGSILTFFPWEGMQKGKPGTGLATEIAYSVPGSSLEFWQERLKGHKVNVIDTGRRFDEEYITFEDPDGLQLTLVVPAKSDDRKGWVTTDVNEAFATKGFHGITLTLRSIEGTASVLTDVLGYELIGKEGNRYRYATSAIETASIVDLIHDPAKTPAYNGAGTVHHLAFRVSDEATLMEFRSKVMKHGLNITPKIDRNYFFSLYFREPGGVLFEIATDNPGFSVDEPVNELGSSLKLPAQYEQHRQQIEEVLPAL